MRYKDSVLSTTTFKDLKVGDWFKSMNQYLVKLNDTMAFCADNNHTLKIGLDLTVYSVRIVVDHKENYRFCQLKEGDWFTALSNTFLKITPELAMQYEKSVYLKTIKFEGTASVELLDVCPQFKAII